MKHLLREIYAFHTEILGIVQTLGLNYLKNRGHSFFQLNMPMSTSGESTQLKKCDLEHPSGDEIYRYVILSMFEFGQGSIAKHSDDDDDQGRNHGSTNCIVKNHQSDAKLDNGCPCLMEPVWEFSNSIAAERRDLTWSPSRRVRKYHCLCDKDSQHLQMNIMAASIKLSCL